MTRWWAFGTGLLLAAPAWGASVRASSELETDEATMRAERAFDGLLSTGWAEATPGTGEGEWIEIRLDRPTTIASVSVWPGNLENAERTLKEDGRPHTIDVVLDTAEGDVAASMRLRDGAEHGVQRVDLLLDAPVEARAVKLTIAQGYAGYLHNDVYVAEVGFNVVAGDTPRADRVEAWLGSSTGERAVSAHRETVIGLFDRIDSAEFGDREAMEELSDFVTDGAPYLRARVGRDVPAGFRVNVLPPDEVAVQALLKLKDPNAIPALQLGRTRSTGATARGLANAVSYFEAFAELKGGGRRVLPPWGSTGWEVGALRSFGEPLGLARGSDGTLHVADLGNHRVVTFDGDGRVTAIQGADGPVITDVWFGRKRDHYVSGSKPGKTPGTFAHPLAVESVPTKDGDELIVLDATKRVQWFTPSGGVKVSWKVLAEMGPTPGVGGVAHVLRAKKQVVVIWGTDAFVYDEAGEEVARWSVEDGAPTTAVVLKNGKLLLGFRSGAVIYTADGFRFGDVLAEDDLPLGYEAWTLTVDDKGKVWAVTDHGWAVKYKKPGTVDYKVRWSEFGATAVRAVAEDDRLWISHDDTITEVDALQLKADADEAAASE